MKYIFAVCLALEAIPTVYSQKATADKLLMISIAVRDMDKSEEFYTSALGLKATQDYSQGGQRWVSESALWRSIHESFASREHGEPQAGDPEIVLYDLRRRVVVCGNQG